MNFLEALDEIERLKDELEGLKDSVNVNMNIDKYEEAKIKLDELLEVKRSIWELETSRITKLTEIGKE